ncbi:MAG TPA: UDP-glucose 4-epimerase GalE [Phycisphaerae bacterium]|nr:UDP-glucose 4-epimerase GalE [Phycisphaerae bacterium]
MRVFVTGGAGYVGSHCVRDLVDRGHDVVVFDNLVYGHRAAVSKSLPIVLGDLADADVLRAALVGRGFDAVMHFAAYAYVGESVEKPLEYYRNNLANTLNLLEVMREAGVRKLVFSSTCATYGMPDRVPITEDTLQRPINPYGRSKLGVEWMLQDSARAWGLGSCSLRYFNACGAASDGSIGEDHDPETHLIPIVLRVALGQRPKVTVFGTDYPTPDGTCIRDYIHVEDLAAAHRLAIERLAAGKAEAFNVGTGHGCSVREVIETARAATGRKITVEEGSRRPGDPPVLVADPGSIREVLGWQATHTDIRDIVESAWRWHESHPRGFADR